MIQKALKKVVNGYDLQVDEMRAVMESIMEGQVDDIHITAFLTAMKMKGETPVEIASAAQVMRDKAVVVDLSHYHTVDTCGTGGDGAGTFNISTAVAFVTAAAGCRVVKHGNRSVSSKSGSADVLEAMGADIMLTPDQTRQCVEEVGMGFFYAPTYHPAMRHVMGVRRSLGYRTIFNILGPLANPAQADCQVMGVFSKELMIPMAEALRSLGVQQAMIVHGQDGLDELSVTDGTDTVELCNGEIRKVSITPEQFGMKRGKPADLLGGDAKENAEIIRKILSGRDQSSRRDIVALNAGAALYIAGQAKDMASGVQQAEQILDQGVALEKLSQFVHLTQSVGGA